MTQKDKELLLIDLCARLPYEVMVQSVGENKILGLADLSNPDLFLPKPYLRPMSSMTEDEKKEYHSQVDIDIEMTSKGVQERFESGTFDIENQFVPQYYHIDWLNKHHFDYRGLIEKGLALEAPEGMY